MTGNGTLTGWQYQQKEDNGNFGSWSDISATSTSLNHTVTGLTNGAEYQFKVRTANATGTGAESDASDAVSPAVPPDDGGGVLPDSEPRFAGVFIPDQVYTQNVVIGALALSAASDGELTYTLTPALPSGLAFNATARTISGTPTAAMVGPAAGSKWSAACVTGASVWPSRRRVAGWRRIPNPATRNTVAWRGWRSSRAPTVPACACACRRVGAQPKAVR